jgi:hypothetical protein
MKTISYFSILLFTLIIISCSSDPRAKLQQTGIFGKPFTAETNLDVTQVMNGLDTANNIPVVVQGTISNFCKGEGCWLTLKNPSGKDLLIEVENKAFILPYNIGDKTAIVHGTAVHDASDSSVSVIADGIEIK